MLNTLIRDLLIVIILASTAHANPLWDHPSNAHFKARLALLKTLPDLKVVAPANPGVRAMPALLEKIQIPERIRHQARPEPAPCVIAVDTPGPWDLVAKEAEKVGVNPVVMYAIQWHETGGYRSSKWRRWNNPGGIEYRHFEGISCVKHGRWAGFASPEEGIKAHAYVLANPRYDGARRTADPLRQVDAFYRGGYCEPGYNWTAQVKNFVRRFLGLRKRVDKVHAIAVD